MCANRAAAALTASCTRAVSYTDHGVYQMPPHAKRTIPGAASATSTTHPVGCQMQNHFRSEAKHKPMVAATCACDTAHMLQPACRISLRSNKYSSVLHNARADASARSINQSSYLYYTHSRSAAAAAAAAAACSGPICHSLRWRSSALLTQWPCAWLTQGSGRSTSSWRNR
jgi:hypothetical protein